MKSLKEMTKEERALLPVFTVSIGHIETTDRNTKAKLSERYEVNVIFDPSFLKVKFPISQVEWSYIVLSQNLTYVPKVFPIKCPVRLLKGVRKDGTRYYRFACYINENKIVGNYFTDKEAEILAMLKQKGIVKNLNFEEITYEEVPSEEITPIDVGETL